LIFSVNLGDNFLLGDASSPAPRGEPGGVPVVDGSIAGGNGATTTVLNIADLQIVARQRSRCVFAIQPLTPAMLDTNYSVSGCMLTGVSGSGTIAYVLPISSGLLLPYTLLSCNPVLRRRNH